MFDRYRRRRGGMVLGCDVSAATWITSVSARPPLVTITRPVPITRDVTNAYRRLSRSPRTAPAGARRADDDYGAEVGIFVVP